MYKNRFENLSSTATSNKKNNLASRANITSASKALDIKNKFKISQKSSNFKSIDSQESLKNKDSMIPCNKMSSLSTAAEIGALSKSPTFNDINTNNAYSSNRQINPFIDFNNSITTTFPNNLTISSAYHHERQFKNDDIILLDENNQIFCEFYLIYQNLKLYQKTSGLI